MKRFLGVLGLATILLCPSLVLAKDLTIGLILVGPYNDKGYSQAQYDGGKYVEEKLPGAKLIYLDKVNPADRPGLTIPQVVDDLVEKGADLIIAGSDDMKDGIREAASLHPDKTFIHVSGDGSFQMNMHELSTVVAHRLPIKMIVMNNDSLGMVRQLQHYYCGARYCQIDLEANPDFVKIADAYGIPGFKVGSQDEVEPALRKAFEVDGPALVDIKVPASINVVPMVPSGKTLNDMVT